MDNQEIQVTPELETKFGVPLEVTDQTTGRKFTIQRGLPRRNYTSGMVFVPEAPHVFVADYFEVTAEGERVVEKSGVNVLLMHGTVENGSWVPKDPTLKDIPVENIVEAYENASGETIDALFVCNPKNGSRVRVIPFSGKYDKPRIFMRRGMAEGSITLNTQSGEVNVQMKAPKKEDIEYQRWLNKGRVRVIS